jgi:hypothetical protein
VEVKINAFLISSLDEGESISCFGHFMPTKIIFNITLLGGRVSLRDIIVKAEVTAPNRNLTLDIQPISSHFIH